MRWIVRNPLGLHAICLVGRVPAKAVKLRARWRLGVLDAKPVALAAMNNRDRYGAGGDLGRMRGVVAAQGLWILGDFTVDEQCLGVATMRGQQLETLVVELHHAEVSRCGRVHYQVVSRSGTKCVVARLQPLQTDEREPSVGLLQFLRQVGAPSEQT